MSSDKSIGQAFVQELSNGDWEWSPDGGFDHGVVRLPKHIIDRIVSERENPCRKIFSHKWLDHECVENGCQSLKLFRSPWHKTAELPPTEKNADEHGRVMWRAKNGIVVADDWSCILWPHWMPIPPLPKEGE